MSACNQNWGLVAKGFLFYLFFLIQMRVSSHAWASKYSGFKQISATSQMWALVGTDMLSHWNQPENWPDT